MKRVFPLLLLVLGALPVVAQVKVQSDTTSTRTERNTRINANARDISTTATDGNTASVTVGGIGEDVDVQGVTVINGKVWIDGQEVPAGATRYKSKTGTTYRIERKKSGSVSVTSE